MAVEKVYKCDLCGEFVQRGELMRLGVRKMDDRPEDADLVDVGPCCGERPVIGVIAHAKRTREEILNGEPAPA